MTTHDQYGYDDSVEQQPDTNALEREEVLPGRALNASQKKAIAAALLGTAALGGAAYGLSRLEDGDGNGNGNGSDHLADGAATDTAPTTTHAIASAIPASFADTSHDVAVISDEPRLATTVSDDMTFDEAFAVARTEMGPGDYFEWRGDYYNTFYKEEWDGLSETEHQAFKASLGDLVETEEPAPAMAHHAPAEPAAHHHAPTHHVAHHATAPVVPVAEVVSHANVSVIDEIAGANSNVTVMHVDGHDISLIDANNDKATDMTLADNNVVLMDTDHDHKLDSQGSYNAATHQLDHIQPLQTPIGAPEMEAEDRQLPADYEQLYTGHDLIAGHGDHMAHGSNNDAIYLGD